MLKLLAMAGKLNFPTGLALANGDWPSRVTNVFVCLSVCLFVCVFVSLRVCVSVRECVRVSRAWFRLSTFVLLWYAPQAPGPQLWYLTLRGHECLFGVLTLSETFVLDRCCI